MLPGLVLNSFTSSHLPTLASQGAEITDMSHRAQLVGPLGRFCFLGVLGPCVAAAGVTTAAPMGLPQQGQRKTKAGRNPENFPFLYLVFRNVLLTLPQTKTRDFSFGKLLPALSLQFWVLSCL